jgi:hypothetical protein
MEVNHYDKLNHKFQADCLLTDRRATAYTALPQHYFFSLFIFIFGKNVQRQYAKP